MTETDAEFVERMQRQIMETGSWAALIEKHEDMARLARLARRGAAVQWRPISEAPKDGAIELILAGQWPSGGWEVQTGSWLVTRWPFVGFGQPTHFIPLNALGEPNE